MLGTPTTPKLWQRQSGVLSPKFDNNVVVNPNSGDYDFSIGKNISGDAYKYDAGLDYHLFSGDWESDVFKYLDSTTGGSRCVFIGVNAGSATLSSVAVGYDALSSNTGNNCQGIGLEALANNTGANGTGIGYQSMKSNSGSSCTSLGYQSMFNNTGNNSNGIGSSCLRDNTGANSNGIGTNALTRNSGNNSNGFGTNSLADNSGDSSNGFGGNSLRFNTGTSCNGFGLDALTNNTGVSSNGFGFRALYNNTGSSSVGIGHQALYDNSAAFSNGIGYEVLRNNSGIDTNAFGFRTLRDNAGKECNVMGNEGFISNTNTVGQNTGLGHQVGYLNSSGQANLFLGYQAGYNETGSNKLYISNSSTTNPLLYGEFDNQLVKVNGRLRVTDNVATAAAGDIRYNSSTNKHQGYDGTSWNDMY